MTEKEFSAIKQFRNEFRTKLDRWASLQAEILQAQKELGYAYEIVHPLVCNSALFEIKKSDCIKLIVIGDNPGKNEQEQNRYLVGMSGKLAEKFFREHKELKIDFRRNTIILNKTPIHTAKTKELLLLAKKNDRIADFISDTQKWTARKTARLHQALFSENRETALMIVGYGELKKRGIFIPYRDELLKAYKRGEKTASENTSTDFYETENMRAWEKVFVFQHFSMNRFAIDLHNFMKKNANEAVGKQPLQKSGIENALRALGTMHRKEIFGE